MKTATKTVARSTNGAAKVSSETTVQARQIRYMSRNRARKAGQWAIKKYSGVFKKLAA